MSYCIKQNRTPNTHFVIKSNQAIWGCSCLPPPQFDVLLVWVSFKALGYPVPDFQQAVPGVLQLFLYTEPLVRFIQLFQCLFHRPHPLLTLEQTKSRDIKHLQQRQLQLCLLCPKFPENTQRPPGHIITRGEAGNGRGTSINVRVGKTWGSSPSSITQRDDFLQLTWPLKTLLFPHLQEGHDNLPRPLWR